MIKLIFELIIILLIVYIALYMIDPAWTHKIVDMALGITSNTVTTTVTIPYANHAHTYVNGSFQDLSYSFSNDTVLYVTGGNNKILVTEQASTIPILYVNMTGAQDTLTIKNGFVVLNVWGGADTISLYNATLLSSNLHGNGDYVYNESEGGNYTIANTT
jgi:hypothetical protein